MSRKRRYIGPGEWKEPRGYQWENRSEQPSPIAVTGIVERDGLWIGRVTLVESATGSGSVFGFVVRHDEYGMRILRFAGEWPAETARRRLVEDMERLATEELWNGLGELGG